MRKSRDGVQEARSLRRSLHDHAELLLALGRWGQARANGVTDVSRQWSVAGQREACRRQALREDSYIVFCILGQSI